MKRSLILLSMSIVTFSLTIGLPGTSFAAQKKPVVLRLIVPSPAGDWPLTYKDMELAKRFNSRANGEYMIEVHTGGALARVPEYFDAVRTGVVEMADIAWAIFAGADPRLAAMEAPFLFNNIQASVDALPRLLPLYDQILQEKFNAKALGLLTMSGMELVSKKPIRILEDWKGQLVGAISPMMAPMIKSLGGAPVSIMWTDLYEALQKNTIDATIMGTNGTLNWNLTDACKNLTLFYGMSGTNGYTINLDTWKKMPEHIQKILLEEVTVTVDWMNTTYITLGEQDMKEFKKRGSTVYELPPAERERWATVAAPVRDRQLADLGEFGRKVRQIADEANAKFPYKVKVSKP
jgi:TRAP-type C4-dicarboxylate transport system substrate-binding protein